MKSHQIRILTAAICVVAVLSFVGATLPTLAAPSFVPSLKLDPGEGTYDTVINLGAFGFTPEQSCDILWNSTPSGTIDILKSGDGQTYLYVPEFATLGINKVVVSCSSSGEFAEDYFNLVDPSPTPTTSCEKLGNCTPTPTKTPTPKAGQPQPCGKGTCTPTITPSPTPTGYIFFPIILPPRDNYTVPHIPMPRQEICTGLNLGQYPRVIGFDDLSIGSLTNYYSGLNFTNANVGIPPVGTRSTNKALSSPYGDMGSYNSPIQVSANYAMDAVGMYVGREAPQNDRGEVTAVLSGFGYDRDGQYRAIVTSSITLPATPVDINRCLSVRAPEGLALRAVTLEYYTQDDRSAIDRRWMDDLTIVPSNIAGQDRPPVVNITSPIAGRTIIDAAGVGFTVNITEDIRLNRMEAIVNGGSPIPVTFRPATGGDPTRYEANFSLLAANGMTAESNNTVRVVAYDSAGQTGDFSVTFYWQALPPLNIEVVNVEYTQVIQCMNNPTCPDNTVPLFDSKATLVRMYVRTNGLTANNIGGRLCINSSTPDCTTNYIDSYNRVSITNVADPVSANRGDLTRTINFIIPAATTRTLRGDVQFWATVNYQRRDRDESRYDDNSHFDRLYVEPSKYVDIVFVPIRINNLQPTSYSPWIPVFWMQKVYPTTNFRVYSLSTHTVDGSYDFNQSIPGRCNDAWSEILDSLWWLNFWTDDPTDWTRYYGLVPASAATGSNGGCGTSPGDEAGGRVERSRYDDGRLAAEEVGHNHGLPHAPSGGAMGADPAFPNSDGKIEDWGVDVAALELKDPNLFYDFMGYMSSEWVSIYNYLNLDYNIQRIAVDPGSGHVALLANQQGQPQDVLVVSGSIEPTMVDLPNGVMHTTLASPQNETIPEGPYTIQLVDAYSTIVYEQSFAPFASDTVVAPESGPFHLVIPWVEGTTTVMFTYNGQYIGGVVASANPPYVSMTDPAGDVTWGDSDTAWVYWVGKDEEPITYTLQFSADGGATWQALATGLTEMQYEVNVASLPGTNQGKLRVIASDGFNTSSDESDGLITIPNRAPDVFIAAPTDGYSLPQSYPLILQALGTDPEDGPLADAAFSWSSSLDGSLGTGVELVLYTLSVGQHTITLTGTDSSGLTGTYSVTVNIQPPPTLVPEETQIVAPSATNTPQPRPVTPTVTPAAASDSSGILIVIILVLAVALVIVVVVLVMRNKKK